MRNWTRRDALIGIGVAAGACASIGRAAEARPNILFAIADDLSWRDLGANGCRAVRTPAFDRVAGQGVLFRNAFCAAPQCSPDRAAILTGRHIWQLREAGTHASSFPADLAVYPDALEKAGYQVGFTGKAWGPGNWQISGRKRNPAGVDFSSARTEPPSPRIGQIDYAANFEAFIKQRSANQPFCFWYGAQEPHRQYDPGSGRRAGKRLEDVEVPKFLPDTEQVRSDILDYLLEVEWFDRHLGRMLELLDSRGLADNTLVVVTSDNGFPFPRAKANLYEYGIHMPLAVRWPSRVKGGRTSEALVSFVDFAPTFFEAAGVRPPGGLVGKSLVPLLAGSAGSRSVENRWVLCGRERHSHARFDNLGYPARAIRTARHLYIHNLKPDRWPAGDPDGYHDIDPSPTKELVVASLKQADRLARLALEKRPAEELYDVSRDPDCLNNLAGGSEHEAVRRELAETLAAALREQGDPRYEPGQEDVFDSYPRYSPMRPELGGFAEQGKYNPRYAGKKRE
ncbi:MAG: heparan N-sulfatase [Acidobacteria bacterium]|nr:MAG: heparan N-sulfatase [Acidobacteriota bacterium]